MGYNSQKGASALAAAISDRAREISGLTPPALDFGAIQADYSLKTNNFAKPIPKGEYSVLRQLTLGPAGSVLTATLTQGTHGGHISGNGTHDHTIQVPEKMRSLKPGDRVLVAWVQNEAVVLDIVTKS